MQFTVSPQEPFNAEPPQSALFSAYLTPADLFYKRNHGPIPIVDDIEKYVDYVKLYFFGHWCSLSTNFNFFSYDMIGRADTVCQYLD